MKMLSSLVLVLASVATLQAGTKITFKIVKNSEIEQDGTKTNTVEQYNQKVFLGSDVIDVADHRIRVYDFTDRKIFTSCEGKEGFIRTSLFSDIGFRTHEFNNRLYLGNALQAANIQDNPMDRVLMEHLFSLSSEETANLDRAEADNTVTFSHNGKPLFEHSGKGTEIPNETVDQFILFTRYVYGMHPDILKALADLNYIPNRMIIYQYNTGKADAFHLELKQVQQDAEQPRRKVEIEVLADGPVFELAGKAREIKAEDYQAACQSILKRASDMAGKEMYLDAAALFIGYGLASGKQSMPPAFLDWREKLLADPDVQAMFTALSPKSKEDAEKATETFGTLIAKATDGKFSLLIFRANMFDSLGQPQEAAESFLAALQQEPATVGAWKDLGDTYFNMYRPGEAWTCWDAGRTMNPEHKLFDNTRKFETSLLTDHPEFFIK